MSFAEQLTRLQVFLDADELHEEALDYVAAHGYLTALSICAEDVPEREWIDALFAEITIRTVAFPAPEFGRKLPIQSTLLRAFHEQPGVAVRAADSSACAEGTSAVAGETVYRQGAAA